jgi:two-component system phosphate regulon sensor histidine kinase PhoR
MHSEDAGRYYVSRSLRTAPPSFTWSSDPKAQTHPVSDYETLLLAIAGHDLRQPVQVIQSAHELLGMGARTKSELRLLRTAELATVRLIAQLDQLLAALRLRHPERVKTMPIQLSQLFRNIASENQYEAVRKGVKFRVVSSRICIRSDVLLFSAVLRNLVRNAVQHTNPGGQVLIGCRRAGGVARIEVYNTGSGIADNDMPQIVEMFARGSQCSDGHGVGLYIVKQAVGILGHRLEVTSMPSRGSRFRIIAEKV